jgi:CRISPR-associated endonuclease/helicase Cas3
LSTDEIDLLVYLVASHHGKVRMSLRGSPDDEREDVPDPCPADKRQARGVRDGDLLQSCRLPGANLGESAAIDAPTVTLSLDPMELGLSRRYGASWRERTQLLLERLGPFRLSYLEALLRAADCRASQEEDERGRGTSQ